MARTLAPLLVLLLLAAAGWAWLRQIERARPQDLPWTPLDLGAPIGAMTGMKLQRLHGRPAECVALLRTAGVAVTPVPERRDGPGCGLVEAVTVDRTALRYSPTPLTLSCPAAAALVVWERQVVQPAARANFGREATGVAHFGTYSCRRLYGRATGPYSEHATANAIDVAGVRLAGGRLVSVRTGWHGPAAEAAFLRALHDGACRLFGTTLGPDYNAAHRDHLHLDMAQRGGFRSCR